MKHIEVALWVMMAVAGMHSVQSAPLNANDLSGNGLWN